MNNNILCVGEVLIDGLSVETIDNLQQANALDLHVGGSVANFCYYLNKCNVNATLIASVGNDGFGKKIIETLNQQHINTQFINIAEHSNTSFIAVAKTAATPDFIAYRDADKEIEAINIELIENSSILHSTAFCLSQQPASQTVLDAFAIAHQHNKLISIDWNYAPSIWKNKSYASEVFTTIQQYNPLLKFSLDDVSRFMGKELNEQEAIEFLNTVAAKIICLTCGAKGVYYKTTNSDWHFTAAQKIQVKNATGAGDAFWAGFISAYVLQQNIDACVQQGINIAGLKLQDLL